MIPALEELKGRPDVVFIELSTEDTDPIMTEGFTNEDIQKMGADNLRVELTSCNAQEVQLSQMLTDLRKRRNKLNNILTRKSEIDRYGVHYRP